MAESEKGVEAGCPPAIPSEAAPAPDMTSGRRMNLAFNEAGYVETCQRFSSQNSPTRR
jgi:hypothetical protein